MIAVILVGGEGTRLRPLTLDRPKAMLPIAGRPFLAHMLERLATAGVQRVVFSCGYLPDPIVAGFGDSFEGMSLEYAVEPEPMDTAGAIRFAIEGRLDDAPFFALNGDVLMEAPLGELMDFHVAKGARATVTLTEVPDPTRYGLVLTDGEGRVEAFVEKPEPGTAVQLEPPYWINAGAYVLDRWFLDTVPFMRRVNIEREVFPQLVGHGLYAWRSDGYWNDIGTPESYLAANMHLSEGATVHGEGATLADGATADRSVLHEGAMIGAGAVVTDSVIGRGARIGARARITGGSIVAAGVHIDDDRSIHAERVFKETSDGA
jgi:NDP-sugar pyrophosphorylase family protein